MVRNTVEVVTCLCIRRARGKQAYIKPQLAIRRTKRNITKRNESQRQPPLTLLSITFPPPPPPLARLWRREGGRITPYLYPSLPLQYLLTSLPSPIPLVSQHTCAGSLKWRHANFAGVLPAAANRWLSGSAGDILRLHSTTPTSAVLAGMARGGANELPCRGWCWADKSQVFVDWCSAANSRQWTEIGWRGRNTAWWNCERFRLNCRMTKATDRAT